MAFEGMDIAAVEELAARLEIQARAVSAVVGVVDSAVAGLEGVWHGTDLLDFRSGWLQSHRPRAIATGDQLLAWVSELRVQAAQQESASGGSAGAGPGSIIGSVTGSLLGGLGAASREVNTVLGGVGLFSAMKDVREGFVSLQLYRKYGSVLTPETLQDVIEGKLTPTPGFGAANKVLGAVGVVGTGAQLFDGFQSHDAGEKTTGFISAGLLAMGKIPPLAPVAAAGEITLAVGSEILPVNNGEYAVSYDMAMREHFGSAYNPDSLTSEQAQWGVDHYSGVGGFLNSIGDGLRYKMSKMFTP